MPTDSNKQMLIVQAQSTCLNCSVKELLDTKEKLRAQGKELKEAHSQRKMAMQEFSELNERLTELRSHKQRIARQLRDKEEEVEGLTQKLETLRLEIRKAERARREVGRESLLYFKIKKLSV